MYPKVAENILYIINDFSGKWLMISKNIKQDLFETLFL